MADVKGKEESEGKAEMKDERKNGGRDGKHKMEEGQDELNERWRNDLQFSRFRTPLLIKLVRYCLFSKWTVLGCCMSR